MPYKNPADRNYKKEYLEQRKRGEQPARTERERARRKLDREGVNRKGKDIAHRKALIDGGSNKDGIRLESPHQNRSYARKSDHKPKSAYDKHFRRK